MFVPTAVRPNFIPFGALSPVKTPVDYSQFGILQLFIVFLLLDVKIGPVE
jgi:hypothetical protein